MSEVSKIGKNLAEQAFKSGIVKLGIIILQDLDGNIHKTEFGFETPTINNMIEEVEHVDSEFVVNPMNHELSK